MSSFPTSLAKGYRAFKQDKFTDERERYRRLAEQGQVPETMIIACCDSRAAPETIFNALPGEMFVVPKGTEHKPVAKKECKVLLIEPKGVVNTGETESDLTADNDVWI